MIRLVQLSDLHLLEPGALTLGKDCAASLTGVIESFPAPPDVVVVTGDITHDGSAEAYEVARSVFDGIGCDVHVVPGNHDERSVMGGVLGDVDGARSVPLVSGWSLVLVSSQWDGHDAGMVDAETLAQLEEALGATRDDVVVCVHHPPVATCESYDCSLVNRADVDAVIARSGRVRVVLSGHLHDPFEITRNGTSYLGGPSTFEQLAHGGEPHFRPTEDPPAARLIELGGDGAVTHRLFTV